MAAALARHGERAAEAFLREVCWRTYWKGWLELRPRVWDDYREDLEGSLRAINLDPGLRDRWEAATSGCSGIACFDAWVQELIQNGYLHNHARMWFASLWIFTLRLPWVLGADFFLRHLLDGDPASNTLSWRWVGGLQTRGKTYRASPENIARFTAGRFRPEEGLTESVTPLDGPPSPRPGRLLARGRPGQSRTGMLLTEEDLNAETLPIGGADIAALAALTMSEDRSPLPIAPLPRLFTRGAIADGLERAARHFGIVAEPRGLNDPEEVASWAADHALEQVLTAEAPVGATAKRLRDIAMRLEQTGVPLVRLRRDWDEMLWPHATAGFFPFKENLARVWRKLGLESRNP